MPDTLDPDEWFSLQELTKRLGALVWVEEQLADIVQRWSAADGNPRAAVVFATTAGHHLWHAQVLRDCLPTSPQLEADRCVIAPTAGWQSSVDVLRQLGDPDATATRLRAMTRVLDPWLEREITALRDLGRPVSDAAHDRWLRFVAIDHDDDASASIELLASLGDVPTSIDDHRIINSLDLT